MAPRIIYLQWDPTNPDGSTWCQDQINNDDEVYRIASDMESLEHDVLNLEGEIEILTGVISDVKEENIDLQMQVTELREDLADANR